MGLVDTSHSKASPLINMANNTTWMSLLHTVRLHCVSIHLTLPENLRLHFLGVVSKYNADSICSNRLHRIPSPLRLLRLPSLPPPFLRPYPRTCRWHRRHPQCLYHPRSTNGHLRFRHLTHRQGYEAGHGKLRV